MNPEDRKRAEEIASPASYGFPGEIMPTELYQRIANAIVAFAEEVRREQREKHRIAAVDAVMRHNTGVIPEALRRAIARDVKAAIRNEVENQ